MLFTVTHKKVTIINNQKRIDNQKSKAFLLMFQKRHRLMTGGMRENRTREAARSFKHTSMGQAAMVVSE